MWGIDGYDASVVKHMQQAEGLRVTVHMATVLSPPLPPPPRTLQASWMGPRTILRRVDFVVLSTSFHPQLSMMAAMGVIRSSAPVGLFPQAS